MVLIPKKDSDYSIDQYRPIVMANFKFKVIQGGPLSPILFCIAKEVLNRGISRLVEQGKLDLIARYRVFNKYVKASGQRINPSKSTSFTGSITNQRLNIIENKFGFNIGYDPFS
ncbi:hypothetical protein KIW84_066422 [Lathyrus oleraceus]|uniref:Reverse transcriptase n=1 Tax=Pisum sativum TaxID=3888 RepID=A0A9D5ABL0_PEA|nr:hypothetical protein KIW84_066422 [Pisum sativum]